MGTGAYLVRSEVRRGWRRILLTSLMIAFVVGVVLTAAAGARRTRTAFDRYLESVNGVDLAAFTDETRNPRELEALDGVEAAIGITMYAAFPRDSGHDFYPALVPGDGRIPGRYMRLPLVEGRRSDPSHPLEVNLGERSARRLGVEVGDALPMVSFTPEQGEAFVQSTEIPEPAGPVFDLAVVGIVRTAGDIVGRESDIDFAFLTPAFGREYGEEIAVFARGAMVVVEPGVDPSRVEGPIADRGDYDIDTSISPAEADQLIDPTLGAMSIGLWLFAGVVAVVGLIAIAQGWLRRQAASADDDVSLRGLGVRQRTLVYRTSARELIAVAMGVPIAVVLSVAASPLLPYGLARRADPEPGVAVDPAVVVVGALAATVLLSCLVVLTSSLTARRFRAGSGRARTSRTADWAAGRRFPVPAVTGIRLALDSGSTQRSVPVRAVIGAIAAAVSGILCAVIVGASLDHAVATPGVYGWGWDADLVGTESDHIADRSVREDDLVADDSFLAVAELVHDLPVTVDGSAASAVVLDDLRGHTPFVVVRGREPAGPAEIAVGAATLADVGARLGDSVRVRHETGPTSSMEIVGVVALPVSEDGGSSSSGVAMRREAADRIGFSGSCDGDETCDRNYALTAAPEVGLSSAAERHIDRSAVEIELPTPPANAQRLTAVSSLPIVLAALLAIIGVVAIAHAAATTVRRRGHELAILRVLGFTASQLRRSVAVGVLVLAVIGAALGVVIGYLLGRQVWTRIADAVSLPVVVEAPPAVLVAVPLATLVVAHLAASLSRRRAGRIDPATVLHGE